MVLPLAGLMHVVVLARRLLLKVATVLVLLPALAISPAFAHDGPPAGAVVPSERIDPRQVYPFGVVAGGGGHFHVLQVMPGERRVFAGTHLGLFVSEDRGLTWRLVAPRFSGVDVHGLARDAATGALYAATHGQGLLVSEDGGTRWRDGSASLPGRDLHALALDAHDRGTIYVWSVGHGLFARRGRVRMWERLAGREALTQVESLAIHPQNSRRLYAGTAAGVLVSEDGGRRWMLPPGGLERRTAGVAVVPSRPDMVLAATFDGVFAGHAAGADWKPLEAAPSWWGPIVGFAFVGDRPDTVFAVSHEGPVVMRAVWDGPWIPLAARPPATSRRISARPSGPVHERGPTAVVSTRPSRPIKTTVGVARTPYARATRMSGSSTTGAL